MSYSSTNGSIKSYLFLSIIVFIFTAVILLAFLNPIFTCSHPSPINTINSHIISRLPATFNSNNDDNNNNNNIIIYNNYNNNFTDSNSNSNSYISNNNNNISTLNQSIQYSYATESQQFQFHAQEKFFASLSKGMKLLTKKYQKLNKSEKKITLLFIAGVEGVGHHMWDLFSKAFNLGAREYQYHLHKITVGSDLDLSFFACWAFQTSWDGAGKDVNKFRPDACFHANKLLKELPDKVQNNTLVVFDRAYSYPFVALDARYFPDIVQLAYWLEELDNPINFKIIVQRRDLKESLMSSCYRFGGCEIRLNWVKIGLSILQTQLMELYPDDYWRILDYNLLESNPSSFADVLSKWIDIPSGLMRKGLQMFRKKPHRKPQDYLKNKQWIQNINDFFYSDISGKYRWPLILSDAYLLKP